MKEFIIKHPIITFLLADAIVAKLLTFGNNILVYRAAKKGINIQIEKSKTDSNGGEEEHGDSGDIQ